jgi:hypothetical protein
MPFGINALQMATGEPTPKKPRQKNSGLWRLNVVMNTTLMNKANSGYGVF